MTATSRTSSNLPSLQNTYRYRQSWLMFLTSLLPYHIPGIVVYIKNILAGWTRPTQPLWLIMQQLPTVFILIYLVTLGNHPKTISPRWLAFGRYALYGIIMHQLLLGFRHPFIIPINVF
ncbi:hypothetical protein CU097_012391 [Rhizopus azygosporus]|uniref:Uncharacterized protein n=1 Tax=Rhizopus azygosporus TaxID=86630 RepID=A0A367KH00_RHIAZ|nr:hypothetical protein CU097_012391 [Rhizopus azygosporus]